MSKVKFICHTSKKRKDGRHPITLRISSGNYRKYIATGFYCAIDEWDSDNEVVNRNYTLKKSSRTRINSYLLTHKALVQNIHDQFIKDGVSDYTPEQFLNYYRGTRRTRITVFIAFERRIEELKLVNKIGNAEMYQTAFQAFRKWIGKDLQLRDITPDLLEKWAINLKDNNAKDTTISAYMRTLRALFNYAISKRWISPEYYPFRDFKVSQFSTETSPRALDPDKIEEFLTMKVYPDQQLAKDIFVFSFYGRGISFIDIALLTKKNIQNQTIIYKRKKLSKKPVRVTFPIRPEVTEIIERYLNNNRGYLLPVLNKVIHKTEQQKKDRIKKVRRKINSDLKKLGEQIGEPDLTTYWARHSYASYMFRKGMSPMMIKESLRHKNLKTTELYIKSLGLDAINDFEDEVFNGLK